MNTRLYCRLLLVCCPIALGVGVSAATVDPAVESVVESAGEPKAAKVFSAAELVRQLGDDAYQTRQQAGEQLAAMGLDARGALEAGVQHSDAEVRRRCRWILQDVLEADFQHRLRVFLADAGGEMEHDLPGWARFSELVGDDQASRKLFIQMLNEERPLLISAAAGAQPAADSFKLRLSQVYMSLINPDQQRRKPPSLATSAALLFVSADDEAKLPQSLADNSYLGSLIQQAGFQEGLTKGPSKAAARRLLGLWIKRPTSQNLLSTKLRMAVQYKIEEGLTLGLRAAANKNISAYMRGYGISAIGQLGGKDHAARLLPLLEDETECTRRVANGKTMSIEVRDVAMAWLIQITGQSHNDYGYQELTAQQFKRVTENSNYQLSASYCVFKEKAERDKALKKWAAYLKKNPLPKPPEVPDAEKPAVDPKAPAGAAFNPVAIAMGMPAAMPPIPDDDGPGTAPLQPAEHRTVRALKVVASLCEAGRYGDAARLLGEILEDGSDRSFRPDIDVPLRRHLLSAAELLVGRMPQRGKEAYRLQFEPAARAALEEAVADGGHDALVGVVKRFFYTDAGAEATYLLALHYFHHGQPLRAALYCERLAGRTDDAAAFEPALSMLLATCWSRSGRPRAAEQVLLAMQARHPEAAIHVGGEDRAVFEQPENALAWLESFVGPPHHPEAVGGWPMFRGGAARNMTTAAGAPFLESHPITTVCDDPLLKKTVEAQFAERTKKHRPTLPRMHPLVVGDSILLRTATHVRALDFADGTLLWESPLEDALAYFLEHGNDQQKESEAEAVNEGIVQRFWQDSTFGTLSSDGYCVFSVEDLGFGFRTGYQRMVVMPDGRRRLDPGWLKDYNLLVAYDVETGKVKWEIGGPADVEGVRQPGTFFLGPPLPLGGRLYATARVGETTRLMELDPGSGDLISELSLTEAGLAQPMPMGMFAPQLWLDDPTRRHGLSPSYADGLLICWTSQHDVVTVDLAGRTIRWVYQLPRGEDPTDSQARLARMHGVYRPQESDRANCWTDASVTVAEGHLLLTPPGSNRLTCLSLTDGELRWSIERRGGLYVGGVDGGNAVVVGCGDVRAIRLADGRDAWPPVPLPPGSLPSGRGFLGDGRYHVPLSTAEVVTVDLQGGRLASRSRSPDEIVPGNLVCCRDVVLSQNVDGLHRFRPLSTRRQALADAVTQRPDDPKALTDRGELLLYEGQITEAVDHLRRAIEIGKTPRACGLLVDALIQGLNVDLAAFRKLAGEFDELIDESDARGRYLERLALAHQRAGDLPAAMATYLELIELKADDRELDYYAAAWVVRRDRYVQGRLAELCEAATPKQRAEIDRQIAARIDEKRLAEFLVHFGFHPAACNVRLKLAGQYIEKKEWSQAEFLLRHVLQSGDVPHRAAAVARLAEMMVAVDRHEEAARFYRSLGDELAETVCLDGKTGGELLDAVAEDAQMRSWLSPSDPWPAGEVDKEVDDKRASFSPLLPLSLAGRGGPFQPNTTVEMDYSGQSFTARDTHGRQVWQVSANNTNTSQSIVWSSRASSRRLAHGWQNGHLTIVRRGNRAMAVDGLGKSGKRLWTCQPEPPKTPQRRTHVFIGVGNRPHRARALPASEPLSLAGSHTAVCFQQEHQLMAVDPLSGELLWRRTDVPENSDLFGDGEILLVTPTDSTEAVVYSMIDGRELGHRAVPPLKQRMWTLGRRVVTWTEFEQETRLTLSDPWTGEDLWQRIFAPDAKPWLVGGDEAAVVDPAGRLAVVTLADGEDKVTAEIDAAKSLEGIAVIRSATRYVLIANYDRPQANLLRSYPYVSALPVSGRAYGFERSSGKRLWATDVAEHALNVDQPAGLPVLTFSGTFQKHEKNRYTTEMRMLCLDMRTGKVIHEKTKTGGHIQNCQFTADPKKGTLDIRNYMGTVKLKFK